MKKCEMPKPKFDIDDLVAFNIAVVGEERADDVPLPPRSKKGAGTISQIIVVKDVLSKWVVSYRVGTEPEVMLESQLKKVNF